MKEKSMWGANIYYLKSRSKFWYSMLDRKSKGAIRKPDGSTQSHNKSETITPLSSTNAEARAHST
jgi:hypothetical protein